MTTQQQHAPRNMNELYDSIKTGLRFQIDRPTFEQIANQLIAAGHDPESPNFAAQVKNVAQSFVTTALTGLVVNNQ